MPRLIFIHSPTVTALLWSGFTPTSQYGGLSLEALGVMWEYTLDTPGAHLHIKAVNPRIHHPSWYIFREVGGSPCRHWGRGGGTCETPHRLKPELRTEVGAMVL